MVALRNIRQDGNLVSCDYLPDGVEAGERIVIDVTTLRIVELIEAHYNTSNPAMYWHLARRRLVELIKSNRPLPERAAIAIF